MKNDFEKNGLDLDQELNSASQMQVRQVVKALPEEALSLSWRSQLNERLRAEEARKRKQNLAAWVWKPGAAVALAGALAVAFMTRLPDMGPVTNSPGVEKALVNTYLEGRASWAVAGDGITANEVKEAAVEPSPFQMDREDVGATL
jgi:hypothetical protein